MNWLADPQTWVALVTLTVLEIVLGIDNIIFISILAGKLPDAARDKARRVGLLAAMVTRILLLLSLAWIIRLTRPLFTVLGNEISGRDLILIAGGLFLLAKSTHEIHQKLEGEEGEGSGRVAATFRGVVFQIMLLDIVFSLDSVITAVGMARRVEVMVAAIMISVALMMWWSKPIGVFVERHPTIKILALSFLLLIGVTLIADGLGQHISKGYVYFAMGFSVFVEMLNLRMKARAKAKPIHLRTPYVPESGTA
jgi:predicted tellurium resistance membrane protein TerC